jgi:orotate phosphoribosyltransferase
MAKASIYTSLFDTKSLVVKDVSQNGEKPYILNFNKTFSNPSLFDNITLLIENSIKTNGLKFDKICSTSSSAIAYATNVATSFEKGIMYINSENNDKNEKDNIKNIKIEGEMNIDDRVLLIETVIGNDFLLNNIIKKIRKYGGEIVGLILILNQCEGEYVNLVDQKEKIINVLNIYDIFNHLENNNQIELFYCEKVKFYCERITKLNIQKLLSSDEEKKEELPIIEPVKIPMPSQ